MLQLNSELDVAPDSNLCRPLYITDLGSGSGTLVLIPVKTPAFSKLEGTHLAPDPNSVYGSVISNLRLILLAPPPPEYGSGSATWLVLYLGHGTGI